MTHTIDITAADLTAGDVLGGDRIEWAEAGSRFTRYAYTGDETPMRMQNTVIVTVEREDGVSTAARETVPAAPRPTHAERIAAEAAAGAERERQLRNDLRRERRQFVTGR